MVPPRTRLDPEGYYARLGLHPAATRAGIVAAFRGKARLLHPDVPGTGNAGGFVAVKQAYDVLSNPVARAAYDRMARIPEPDPNPPDVQGATAGPQTGWPGSGPIRPPGRFTVPAMLWTGLTALLVLCVYEAASHLLAPSRSVQDAVTANAASVPALSAAEHRAALYGPAPVRLPGVPNFYVTQAAAPAVLWRQDSERGTLIPAGQLPPFSQVHAIRLIRQNGMLEVLFNDRGNGFVGADRLTQGNAAAARLAYCSYNAGSTPADGEVLERRGSGDAALEIENRAVQPVVVNLRDRNDAVALSVFLAPGGHTLFGGLPGGQYRAEFAIGELWSRGCKTFAAGMRARRLELPLTVPGDRRLAISPDAADAAVADLSEQAFERN